MDPLREPDDLARRRAIRLNVLVVVAMVALMGVTGVLARAYHQARSDRAHEQFSAAQALLDAGQPEEALAHLRTALSLAPGQLAYRRALGIALIQAGHTREARAHLTSLLELDPVDGEANLLMARLWKDDPAVAERFYQRALYGRWTGDPAPRQLKVRLELVDLLAAQGRTAAVRAELLRLSGEAPDDPAFQRQLAARWMSAGDSEAALDILSRLWARQPKDAETAAALSSAAFTARRFTLARDAAARAVALDPKDAASRARLSLSRAFLSLDPTGARLSARERLRRAARLLTLTTAELETCAYAGTPTQPRDAVVDFLAKAREELEKAGGRRPPADADVALIQTAEAGWALRGAACSGRAVEGDAAVLPLIFEHLAEQRVTAEG